MAAQQFSVIVGNHISMIINHTHILYIQEFVSSLESPLC